MASVLVDQQIWTASWFPTSQYNVIYGTGWVAQTVVPDNDYFMNQIDLPLFNYDLDLTINVEIWGLDVNGDPDSTNKLWVDDINGRDSLPDMAFGAIPTNTWTSFYPNIDVTTDGYAVVIYAPAGTSSNLATIGHSGTSTGNLDKHYSSDSGSTWTTGNGWALAFKTYTPDEPGKAYDPSPESESTKPQEAITLGWSAPDEISGYTFEEARVYLREEGDSWPGSPTATITDFSITSYGITVDQLTIDTTYEWRIDYVFTEQTPIVEGDTWSFTVEYVELSGTASGVGSGSGNFPVSLSGTATAVGLAGTGAGGASGVLTGSLDVSLPPSEINVTKTLYAIGNNEFWYESSNNTMTELAAANGDMDVSNPLASVPAFNKVFIVNKYDKKVADFINIRLTSEAKITTNVPSHGDVLTQVTSGAKLVVDYIYYDTTAVDHYVYGRQVGDTEFDTSNDVQDADTNVIISGANLSAVTSSPLWYNWTEYNYGEDTSFVGLPDGAQLACLYRGRIVLAGNPDDPYQWYMSRQANPFDWAYTAGDAQTAIAGGNGDMGKAGDVIKALIPWHDDYLILGCSKSMHVMRGDPARGGSLDSFDSNTGIFGPKSWCFDSAGNLYFYGTGGIYLAPRDIFVNGAGHIKNISKNALPNL